MTTNRRFYTLSYMYNILYMSIYLQHYVFKYGYWQHSEKKYSSQTTNAAVHYSNVAAKVESAQIAREKNKFWQK